VKIVPIVGNNNVYSSNVYLILGEWKRIEDVNTLVDVGNDPSIVDVIENINTGLGKSKIDQVILTHNHSDHTGILPLIINAFHPRVYAFSPFMEGVDEVLEHGDKIRLGESMFEVIHTPGHSSDSISLYNKERGTLFVGDTQVIVHASDGEFEMDYYHALKTLCKENVREIYFGHGEPLMKNAHEMLLMSLRNVRKSVKNNHPAT
jgi:glyoxylase-like metal-dependent hydrolase (beta-lactamase superfamily II)